MRISDNLRRIIKEFEKHGYYFDEIESYKGGYRFTNSTGTGATWFESQKEMKDYLKNVCWD